MTLYDTIPLQENDPGCQLYFPEKFATEETFPLRDETEEIEVVVIPRTAVVLLPVTSDLDWPLTLRHPSRIDEQPFTD